MFGLTPNALHKVGKIRVPIMGIFRLQLTHERIPPKTPNKNAHIESFHSLLESECLQRNEFENYQEAYEAVTTYIT